MGMQSEHGSWTAQGASQRLGRFSHARAGAWERAASLLGGQSHGWKTRATRTQPALALDGKPCWAVASQRIFLLGVLLEAALVPSSK